MKIGGRETGESREWGESRRDDILVSNGKQAEISRQQATGGFAESEPKSRAAKRKKIKVKRSR